MVGSSVKDFLSQLKVIRLYMYLLPLLSRPCQRSLYYSVLLFMFVTPHAQRERGKVIDRGVHIYTYMSVVQKKYLNRTLEIDSPFQTLTVGLLVEFID